MAVNGDQHDDPFARRDRKLRAGVGVIKHRARILGGRVPLMKGRRVCGYILVFHNGTVVVSGSYSVSLREDRPFSPGH